MSQFLTLLLYIKQKMHLQLGLYSKRKELRFKDVLRNYYFSNDIF